MGLIKFFKDILIAQKKSCRTCFKETVEMLVYEGTRRDYYCRSHLIESFSRDFLHIPYKIVIFEFQPEATKHTGLIYCYYALSSLERFNWTKEEKHVLESLLHEIDTTKACSQCKGNLQQSLYLGRELAPWESSRIHKTCIGKGDKLCLNCSQSRLSATLSNNPKEFREGLYLPFKEDGMYMTTEM